MKSSVERISEFRSSFSYAAVVFILPLFLTVWQYDVVTRGAVEYLDSIVAAGTPVPSMVRWWAANGYKVVPVITTPLVGLWINFFATKSMCIFLNLVGAGFCLVYSISLDLTIIVVSQLALGLWAGATFLCTLAYFCRISSIANRTRTIIGIYFVIVSVSPSLINAFREALGHCPAASLGGFVLFGALLLSCALFLVFQERPVSLNLGELHDPDSACGTVSRSMRRLCSSHGVMSVPAVLACMFLIVSCQFGYSVYRNRLNAALADGMLQTLQAQRGFVYGILGATVLLAFLLWVVIRWVSDRRLLVIVSAIMLAGYMLVIRWGSPSPARFITGAVIITLSDCVVMAIGTALFSKIVTPALLGVWLGLLQGLQWLAQVLAALWINTQNDAPYEATLGISGFALLLMIPVYRALLPQLYSPWSGVGLPAKMPLHDDEEDPHAVRPDAAPGPGSAPYAAPTAMPREREAATHGVRSPSSSRQTPSSLSGPTVTPSMKSADYDSLD